MEQVLSVLIAEDDENDALILQRALKQNGVMRPPHIVHDGAGAIAYLRGDGAYGNRVEHPFPNIVILDLKMPGLSGFDVLQWLNDHPDYRVIPTIVWTASADRRDVKHAFCLGAHAYMCKPVDYNRFVAMVGRMLAFWQDCEKPGVDPSDPACQVLKDRNPFSGAHKTG